MRGSVGKYRRAVLATALTSSVALSGAVTATAQAGPGAAPNIHAGHSHDEVDTLLGLLDDALGVEPSASADIEALDHIYQLMTTFALPDVEAALGTTGQTWWRHSFDAYILVKTDRPIGWVRLEGELESDDWRARHLAHLVTAFIAYREDDAAKAMKHASLSLESIPAVTEIFEGDREHALWARSVSWETLQFQYSNHYDVVSASEAFEEALHHRIASGLPVKPAHMLYNMGIVFGIHGRYDDMNRMINAYAATPLNAKEASLLAHLRGRAALFEGKYDDSVAILRGHDFSNDGFLGLFADLVLMEALADAGDVEGASAIWRRLKDTPVSQTHSFKVASLATRRAEALWSGDASNVLLLSREIETARLNLKTSRLASAQASQRALMSLNSDLSRLELDKATAEARAASAEAEMASGTARRNRIVAVMASLLAAFLAMAGIFSYRRWRAEKAYNDQLSRLRDEAQATAEHKASLISVLSHEFRTPINHILPVAQMLRSYSSRLPDGVDRLVHNLESAAQRIVRIMDDVALVGRSPDKAVVNDVSRFTVDTLVGDLDALQAEGELIAPTAVVRVDRTGLAEFEMLCTDRIKLSRLLSVFIDNGARYSPDGQVLVRLASETGGIRVMVEDGGGGLAPEVLRDVTEPFRQADGGLARHHEGLGLGFSVAAVLAADIGADIHIEGVHSGEAGIGLQAQVFVPLLKLDAGLRARPQAKPVAA